MDSPPTNALTITPAWSLRLDDVVMEAMRASGAGGQNVNKVSSAIHLRINLKTAQIPDKVRERLLLAKDRRISADGTLVLKAQRFRTQARNRDDALERLVALLREASVEPRRRLPTRPSKAARRRRMDEKDINSKNKVLRKKPQVD